MTSRVISHRGLLMLALSVLRGSGAAFAVDDPPRRPAQIGVSARSPSPRPQEKSTVVIAFPRDPSVIHARRDLGAKGDGKTDDTEALQRGLDLSVGLDGKPTRVMFLPQGVYRVSRTLVVKSGLGPWLYGESRDRTTIALVNGAKDCNSVLRTHPNEKGPTSADWFMRNIRHLTIDVGKNPETDGIRYHATNSGIIQDVRVTGHGKIGINSGFLDKSGPNLIQDVEIDGFETGIQAQWIWGETLSRVRIKNCRKQGLYVSATAVAVEDLTVENTPLPVFCDYPNDWTWWGGVLALVGGTFRGGDPQGPAIRNRSILFARDVQAEGFKEAIHSDTPGGSVAGKSVTEYISHEVKSLFPSPSRSIRLPIKPEPEVPWEKEPSRWVCANEFGAKAGDNLDDAAAIQKAIDFAAAKGKTTVFLRGVGGPDPNWYNLESMVRLHGSVRHVLGLGFGRVLGGKSGGFLVDDESAPVVKFQSLDAFGGAPVTLENRSAKSTMVVESCGVRIVGDGKGDIFATDCPSLVDLRKPGQKLWARQLNPEGDSDLGLVQNLGGDLWAMGVKFEGKGVRFRTASGGRTEVFGMFLYGPGMDPKDPRPIFDVDHGSLSVMGLREIAFDVPTYPVKVREHRGTETRSLTAEKETGWIGWALFNGWKR